MYHFAVRPVQDKYGIPYTEVMATDVTQLAALHAALQQENERLADANRRAKRLYDNMPDIVREEEILKMKMRVHDDIGHTPCLPHGAHCGMSMTLPGSRAKLRSGKVPSPCYAAPGRRMLPRIR